jgi:hypothetical protein
MSTYKGAPWPEVDREDIDLYPGLVVNDARVSGSITTGESRLPLWCFAWTAVRDGWGAVEDGWEPSKYGWGSDEMGAFLSDLLEMRGEFARLLLVLADAERCERTRGGPFSGGSWWETKRHRKRIADQLRRCLDRLEDDQ